MKKIPKILSMVIVVALIAAIPASTQIMTGIRDTTSDENNLPLLILVNRLELSEDQMDVLDDILRGLIAEKDAVEAAAADFELAMIDFNGTGEELDAMLATFREEQVASGEALRESIKTSLDEVRDLLSINQGLILQEEFPQLMGGILLGADQGTPGRMSGTTPAATSIARGGRMIQQSPRGQMPMSDQRGSAMDHRFGGFEDEATSRGFQEPVAGRMDVRTQDDMETMMAQRFGQNVDDETMAEQMRARLEQIGDQAGARMDRGDLRQTGGVSFLMQRGQSVRDESRDLFGGLEQIADVLELKLEAME